MTKDGPVEGPTKYFFAMVSCTLFFLYGIFFKMVSYVNMDTADKGLLAVLRLHSRHNLPHNGTHVVARPTLRLRLRFPRR